MKNIFLLSVLLGILLSFSLASATVFLNIYGNGTLQPCQNVTLTGSLTNDTSTTGARPSVNISSTGNFNSSLNTSSSNSNTTFYLNVTAPCTTGDYNTTIYTNNIDIANRTIGFHVSNATTANITYIGSFPPFTNGTSFVFKLTLLNGAAVLANNTPNVTIYLSDGPKASWTITALNTTTDNNGAQYYNVTIPSSAETGSYVLVIEKGVYASVFQVRSGYIVAVNTLTTSEEVSSNFGQNAVVNVLAKVRDTSSNPVTTASAYALVTLPNSTTRNISLSAHPTYSGYYNNTFNETSATGSYSVKVVARIGSEAIEANTVFNVKTFTARLEPQKEFFFEWGGQTSFKPGQRVGLNIIVTDLTNDSVVPATSMMNCNSTAVKRLDVIYMTTSTSVNSSNEIGNSSIDASGQYLLTNVCRYTIPTAPQTSGIYNIKLNVTYAGTTQTIDGYFAVSRYFMKVAPISALGGEESFMSMVTPGENVTLKVTARNTTTDQDVAGNLITNIRVLRLIPVEFKSGASENTTVAYTVTAGTATTNPQIELHVPASIMGPILVDVEATIGGEVVKGDAFFIANHLMGFLSPGGMGQGEEFSGGFFSPCSGNITFSGMVMETKTLTAAQGVGIIGIIEAREELTGRDVTSFITVREANASGSDGQLKAKIGFTPSGGYSFSGFYFMIFNASYKGKYAGIPSGFMCKKLNFFPEVQSAGSTSFGWRVAPNSNLTVTINNVKRLNDSYVIGNTTITHSNVTILQILNFNPGKGGMKVLLPRNASAMVSLLNKTSPTTNMATFNISPSDFMSGGQNLTEWPSGFMDLQPRVCTQDLVPDGTCDTGFGGFEVVPFDAWTVSWNFGEQVTAGVIKSYLIDARTNVSRSSQDDPLNSFYTGANQTGFQVKMGKPWEGVQTSLAVNATLLIDGWSSSANITAERWNISFQVPTNVKKGDNMVTITVNNSQGQTMDLMMFFQVVKYIVTLPSEEGVGDPQGGSFDQYFVPVDSQSPLVAGPQNTTIYGWDFTNLTLTYGVNSTSGRVCLKNVFNATRYGTGSSQPVPVKDGVRIAVVDRYSATYDTVVLNASGTITILYPNATHRNISAATGQGGWYLWYIRECGSFTGVNTTQGALPQGQATWGGSHQVNVQFGIPYVVTLGSTPQSGVTVSVNGMGKQDNRGFGFESRLTGAAGGPVVAGNNYSFVARNTDANGVAFVSINSTATGRLVAFWKINTSTDSDTATMMTGSFLEVKAFKTSGDPAFFLPLGAVTFRHNTNSSFLGAFSDSSEPAGVYNATVQESSALDFVRDGSTDRWYLVYGPRNNRTWIGTADPVTSSGRINSTSDTIVAGSNNLKVAAFAGNVSANQTIRMLFFQSSPNAPRPSMVTSGTENITVSVCAESFERVGGATIPREGATVRLYVTDWFAFPPSQKNLDMFELLNHTNVTSSLATLGPSGCVVLKVGPGQLGTWPSGKPLFIEGVITYGGNEEAVWVTDVFRSIV